MQHSNTSSASGQNQTMRNYYRFQSRIYDLTRWTFLFGRKHIVKQFPIQAEEEVHILEIGCGTGFNLRNMASRYPKAHFTAFDVSPDMIRLTQKNTRAFSERIKLIEAPYDPENAADIAPADLVLFSYSLTMINPQWSALIELAVINLKPGAYIAVVDFHDAVFPWFKKHMGNNHVRMDGHLLPFLEKWSLPVVKSVKKAYFGIWEYMLFIGKKPTS